MKLSGYLKITIIEAFKIASNFVGINSKSSVFRTLLLWGVTTILILVALEKNVFVSRIQVGLASLLSLFLVLILALIVAIFYSPYALHKKLYYKFKNLEDVIKNACCVEFRIRELSELYYKGKEIYLSGFSDEATKESWVGNLEKWKSGVEEKLEKNFSISELHKFRQLHDYSYYTIKNMADSLQYENKDLLSEYSAYSRNLNEIIQFSPTSWEAAILGAIKEQEKNIKI